MHVPVFKAVCKNACTCFRRLITRHGVLMRLLYSGAWNADVWLLFPMSLADRTFHWDGTSVCPIERRMPKVLQRVLSIFYFFVFFFSLSLSLRCRTKWFTRSSLVRSTAHGSATATLDHSSHGPSLLFLVSKKRVQPSVGVLLLLLLLDLQYHPRQAAKVYHANKWILEDRKVPISQRLRYFDSVVSSVACFAGGHRTMYQEHLQTLDIHFRKFCRSIVGPPPYIDWTLAWHKIFTFGMNDKHTLFASRKLRVGRECVVVRIGNWHLMLFNAPLTTGYEEFCIGNPQTKGDSDVQNCAGRANWRCTVVTKDWFIGRWQHKTVNFGSNISIRF